MTEEEWTFVPPRKGPKRRPARRPNATSPQAAGGGGLYGAARASAGNGRQGADGARDVHQSEEEQKKERERTKCDVLECLRALEGQLQSGRGFASRLLSATVMASEATEDDDGRGATESADAADHATIAESGLRTREIVAYGIGNFATGRYYAPMLQLACLLLLRRCACRPTHQTRDGDTLDAFEREQRQVPIYYYEPCILPVEKALLEDVFHLTVLDTNDMGKRTVESMRQPQRETAITEGDARHTLFYMPHCPMRLYCNVLWAHWDHVVPATFTNDRKDSRSNPLLIFGNSFSGYDEGLISSEKRSDLTNGVLRIIPYAREMSTSNGTSISRRRSDGEIIPDSLRHLEMAFNDCNVISFPGRSSSRARAERPDRPEEHDDGLISSENEVKK